MGRDSQDAYELWLVAQSYTADTIRGYLGVLRLWRSWCATRSIDPFRASQGEFARWLLERRGHASNTLRNNIIAVRIFYRFLGGPNPTDGVRLPRLQLPPVQPYSQDELLRLRAACWKPRDFALFYLLLGGGLRACEVIRLRREEINWERGRVMVHGKGGKERLVTVGRKALKALERCDGFGVSKVSGLSTWIRRLGYRAGVHPAGLQRFRVSYACRLLEAGAGEGSLQDLLGHSSPVMSRHYADAVRHELALEEGCRFNPADRL